MDWNLPTTTSDYATEVLTYLKDRDVHAAKWFDGITDTNLEVGFKRWNETNTRFEKWNGSAWVQLFPALDSHLTSTSNPHSTTAAQVGAPTLAAFTGHTGDTGNPHATTAAQVGAPTAASFNAHVSNTTNPHATTASQVGALATSNALSELIPAAPAARSNIGAASAATLSSHIANVSNPHGVTRAQIGAAASGSNSDITGMSAVATLRNAGGMTIGPTAAGSLTLATASGGRMVLDDANNFYPFSAGGINLGTSANWFNGITGLALESPSGNHLYLSTAGSNEVRVRNNGTHWWTFGSFGIFTPTTNGTLDIGINGSNAINNLFFKGQLRNNGTAKSWTFAAYTPLTTLNPGTATATSCANAINSLFKYLEDLGLIN